MLAMQVIAKPTKGLHHAGKCVPVVMSLPASLERLVSKLWKWLAIWALFPWKDGGFLDRAQCNSRIADS